jgi:catechol 2,3-dioxygenase-like lactoylglutathione lyase family enzyme
MPRFNGICLITPDVARLRAFYTAVLRVEAEGDDTFTVLQVEGAILTLFHEPGMEQMAPGILQGAGRGAGRGAGLGAQRGEGPAALRLTCSLEFGVEDVDAEYAHLLALGAEIAKPPTTQPWGLRSVWFLDPDGNLVNFNAPAGT